MPRSIRLHLDENVSDLVAQGLRRYGIDVTTAQDAGLLSAADGDHLDYCRRERRLVFTHDTDFLRLNAEGVTHHGIAYCRPDSRTLGQIINLLKLIWEMYDPPEKENTVEYL